MTTPENLEETVVILETQCNVIAWLQTGCPQKLRKPVRRIVELTERLGVPGSGHDERQFVRCRQCVNSDVHNAESSAGTLRVVQSPDGFLPEALDEFQALLHLGDAVPLDEALLLVSNVVNAGVDVMDYLVRLDEIAASIQTPTFVGIAQELFDGPMPFSGNTVRYYEPENSYLDQVIDRRLGIPISLAVLMMSVARRLGVASSGVGMPGHFLVGSGAEPGEVPSVFVDAFHLGQVLDEDGCVSLHRQISGRSSFDHSYLRAVSSLEIIDRSLNNLKAIYMRAGDLTRLRRIMALKNRLPTVSETERSEYLRLFAPFN